MALRNDGSRMFDYNGNPEVPSLVLFGQAERRMKDKKAAIEDMQNEYDLLEEQAFKLYKSHVSYTYLQPTLIKKAQAWMSMKETNKDADGNKLDGRKKYEEKDIYEYIISIIQTYLGIDDFQIIRIMEYNFGEAWDIEFTSHEHKWMLEIPIIEGVRMKSFQCYGGSVFQMHISHYDSEHTTCRIGQTFVEEELKDIMQKGLEKYNLSLD